VRQGGPHSSQGTGFILNGGIKRQHACDSLPSQTNGQVEHSDRTLQVVIAKLSSRRLPASLPLRVPTPYKLMLGRAPPREDGAAIEAVLVDEWVKGLRAAHEEARKLISANIEGKQQDQVASATEYGLPTGGVPSNSERDSGGREPNTTDGVQAGRGR